MLDPILVLISQQFILHLPILPKELLLRRSTVKNLSSYIRKEEFKFLRMYSTYSLKMYGFHSYTVCIVLWAQNSRINKDSRLTI